MSKFTRNERGAAVVELALLLPVLFLILGSIYDYGLRVERENTLNNAAQIAARDLSIYHDGSVSQPAHAEAAAGFAAYPDASSPVTIVYDSVPNTACTAGQVVTVKIHAVLTTPAPHFFGATFTAHGTGVAQCSG